MEREGKKSEEMMVEKGECEQQTEKTYRMVESDTTLFWKPDSEANNAVKETT